jgi:diguanylate cyclase (GGDEF)-like protein/PAS domain S-box-containing protein
VLIKHKLPLIIITLVCCPLIILSGLVYKHTSRLLTEKSRNNIYNMVKVQGDTLASVINRQKVETVLLTQNSEFIELFRHELETDQEDDSAAEPSDERVSHFLQGYSKRFFEFDNIFITDINGRIIAGSEPSMIGINVSDREYFNQAARGKAAVSGIIEKNHDEKKVIIIATAIMDHSGEIIGTAANIVDISYYRGYTEKVKLGKTGYAFLIDNNGMVIAHPESEKIGEPVENEFSKDLIYRLQQGEEIHHGTAAYSYRGNDRFMAYSIIPGTDWVLSVAQDLGEINEAARFILMSILLITILCAAIAAYIGLKFSKTMTKPIEQLISAMKRAEQGDLSSQCSYERNDEFGQLSSSFNNMISKLNCSYEELTAVYEELSATEEELRTQYEELQENEDALRNSEERYRLALEGANDAIWEWNAETMALFASDKWIDITGYQPPEKLDLEKYLRTAIHPEDVGRTFADFWEHINNKTPYYKSEFRIRVKGGKYKWVFNRGKALYNSEGKLVKLAGSMTDISERKKNEEDIRFMAYYDPLTKLPNKTQFTQRLKESMLRSLQNESKAAVLLIDLDDFKKINDTLGHDYGDQLLIQISERLMAIKGINDILCRFGGDEFLILLPQIDNEEQVANFAQRILEMFEASFQLIDKPIHITGSIGITIYPDDGDNPTVILKNADTAMYKAKETSKSNFVFYDRMFYDKLERRILIEKILRNAIDNNELHIYYQPQFDIQTNELFGFEALLRLISKEHGFISPIEFIPVAEETGLIVSIGEWVLRNACLKNMEWQHKGYKQYGMSVNISAVQLQQAGFSAMVAEVLKDTGHPAEALELEITESVLVKSLDENVRSLYELRERGVKVALDDFGTGYSSLSYLRKIPINTLKIDKSFIDGICKTPAEEAIAEGIIQLAHKMGLQVVAEGVEETQQLKVLYDKKCDKVQGYLFSKPIPGEEVEGILNRED